MKVLIACEYSGIVRDAFLRLGHNAISCDLLPSESTGGDHYQGDVRDIINDGYDLMIAFPDCTYLCSSGLHWNKRTPSREDKTDRALDFVRELMNAPIKKIAIENPVGRIGTAIRKADQYIQPNQFGHDASKTTGLWLKGLPLLKPTKYIKPRMMCPNCGGVSDYDRAFKNGCEWCLTEAGLLKPRWANQTDSGQNRLPPSKHRWKDRSRTYYGIGEAMAHQWGKECPNIGSRITTN